MKTYFVLPIATRKHAFDFIINLVNDDLFFHFESAPEDIVDKYGKRTFTDAEAEVLKLRIDEMFELLTNEEIFAFCVAIVDFLYTID